MRKGQISPALIVLLIDRTLDLQARGVMTA